MNKRLHAKWVHLKKNLVKNDEDAVFITDGMERSGKSVFTLQQAAFIDPSICDYTKDPELSRICFSAEEFLEAIKTAKKGQCIVFDEAFRGLSSKKARSKVNNAIVEAMMEMGQKNLVIFIVLPTFFLLELYAAVLRSKALFHVTKMKNSNKRYFKVINRAKKAWLYNQGARKGWNYGVYTRFKDSFPKKYPFGAEFERRYRAKKLASLQAIGTQPKQDKATRFSDEYYKEKLESIIIALHKKKIFGGINKIERWIRENAGISISITEIIKKSKEKQR